MATNLSDIRDEGADFDGTDLAKARDLLVASSKMEYQAKEARNKADHYDMIYRRKNREATRLKSVALSIINSAASSD